MKKITIIRTGADFHLSLSFQKAEFIRRIFTVLLIRLSHLMKMLLILDVDFYLNFVPNFYRNAGNYGMLSRIMFPKKQQKSAIWRISHFRRRKVK